MTDTQEMDNLFYNSFGKPDFGLNVQNSDDSFQIQLLFYSPPSKLSADNTVIYTIGLSQRYFDSPCPWIELSFQVPGIHKRPQLEKLGTILGEFIYDTLKVTHFTPNLLLPGLKRQFMPEMQDMMVLEGAGIKPLWLEVGQNLNIRILHLLPVYKEEVPLIKIMGVWNIYRSFIKQHINFLEPNRKQLTEPEFYPEELKLAREVSIYQQPLDEIQLSQQIRNWYIHNAPELPVAKTSQLPLKIENLKKHFGINDRKEDSLSASDGYNHPLDLVQLWERLYAGYYQYKKGIGLTPNPNFTPKGAISLKT